MYLQLDWIDRIYEKTTHGRKDTDIQQYTICDTQHTITDYLSLKLHRNYYLDLQCDV
jgi:hypothetical protein